MYLMKFNTMFSMDKTNLGALIEMSIYNYCLHVFCCFVAYSFNIYYYIESYTDHVWVQCSIFFSMVIICLKSILLLNLIVIGIPKHLLLKHLTGNKATCITSLFIVVLLKYICKCGNQVIVYEKCTYVCTLHSLILVHND